MTRLNHENVVKHSEWFEQMMPCFSGSELRFFLVMEYCKDGSLEDFLIEHGLRSIDLKLVVPWIRQIVNALVYIHRLFVIHRDIKTDNILLDDNKKTAKLADFGFVKQVDISRNYTASIQGTLAYMALEIIEGRKYDTAVDIWAFGIVILQLLLGMTQKMIPDVRGGLAKDSNFVKHLLFNSPSLELNERRLKNDDYLKLATLCCDCLRLEPEDRPTALEMLDILNNFYSDS